MNYAGIGSRSCPKDVLDAMVKLGSWLACKGWTLRSGAAEGCDSAFERGCDLANGKKEIYLPWKGFMNSNSELIVKDKKAFELAAKFHPYYDNLKDGGKKLQARNSHQVLGENLDSPSKFIVCYTEGGKASGGTGQAIRLAKEYGIPVFDFGKYSTIIDARNAFMDFYKELVA